MEQRSEQWLEIKRGKVSSSNAKILMAKRGLGATAHTYARRLLADTIQEHFEENFINAAMQNGIDLEPVAIERYEQETLNEVTQIAWIELDKFQGSSPDGLVGDDGQVEVKCPATDKHMANLVSEECPNEYYDQIQHQLYVSKRKWCDFVSYNPYFKSEHQIKVIRVLPSLEWQELYQERLEQFKALYESYKAKL